MLLATCGAIIAGSPTAWLLERYSWREVFAVAAVAGVVLSVAVAAVVRNRPPHSLVEAGVPSGGARAGLRTALRRRELWPLLLATVGTNGTFYAFAGLWGVPLLTETRGLSNTVAAAYTTAALAVYGVGCPAIGVWSDRVGSDRRRSEGFSGDVDGLSGRQDANSESRSARACTFAKPRSRRRYRRSVRKPGRLPPPSPPPSEAQESRWGRPFQRPRLKKRTSPSLESCPRGLAMKDFRCDQGTLTEAGDASTWSMIFREGFDEGNVELNHPSRGSMIPAQ